jgi:xanthine dehydrogenase accessory factor
MTSGTLPLSGIAQGGCQRNIAVLVSPHTPKIDDLAMLESVRTDIFQRAAMGSRVAVHKCQAR